MKIDGYHGQPDFASDSAGRGRRGPSEVHGRDPTDAQRQREPLDRCRVVSSAMRAATDAPEIRQDMVERAQQKLAAGQLGQDLLRLADRIIDHVLTVR